MSIQGSRPGFSAELGGTTAVLWLWVDDVDAAFYGDRVGIFTDPFGHIWTLSQQVEVVTPEGLLRRMTEHLQPA